LVDIYAALSRMAYMQTQVAKTPTVEGYFKARDKFRLTEPNITIYTVQRKVRATGGSAFQSMTLLQKGYRLSEIAKMREMTLKTVVRHIKPFVEDGVIDIADVHPADRRLLR
jgi:DNA-binding MarR family transcriptional regulator